ncbi:MAG TPA: DEAD/DEAH box helicase family protein [Nocardioides sp.]|uniref:DEAD/DEAH box helicase n=1 Tax=uncultured Nocardioides sp. TaxID=198441 RepID=UPI00262FD05F|nr:DEAD/DEAH box helicase family protein [uncultured Nocardioides sp.]HRD59331.1 DEAD/DEAH box helicase family protein [Nocardioides sp.]HRI95096.1 DEAD/DEAH box helicase family protein [Nocardioides sp.]HRK44871.1 DEAD/DEAH box helicase family protein [Nocardioides sp.]
MTTPESQVLARVNDSWSLRKYQVEAVGVLRRYLRTATPDRAALVSMPTGTGKSAVIAALIAGQPVNGDILVVTPRVGLSRQLREDLESRVWQALATARPRSLGEVRMIPSAKAFLEAVATGGSNRRIWVGTIQMVLEIWRQVGEDQDAMRHAFENVEFAVVDECHYEPSEQWSTALRSTGLKTCLLTATAFRNDDRYFHVDTTYTFRYAHADAESDGFLRRPRFISFKKTRGANPFVVELLSHLKAAKVTSEDRVVVRCGNRDDVRSVVSALQSHGETAVGFHHDFANKTDSALYGALPAPSNRPDARFWVHQNILVEGFDDPRVRVVTFYANFGNDRAVVQQIGRALRNVGHQVGEPALVLSVADSGVEATWRRYLAFDRAVEPKAVALFPTLVRDLLASQPETIYWGGLFRERLDLTDAKVWTQFKYARNVRVWTAPKTFGIAQLDQLAAAIAEEWSHANRRTYAPSTPAGVRNARVIPFVALRNSAVLRDTAFVEPRVGFTALVLHAGHLFVSDSEGMTPETLEVESFEPVDPDALQRALPDTTRMTAVSLRNNDTSAYAIRARSARARNLEEVAAELGDSTYACSTAQGHVRYGTDTVVRYIGTQNGRVRDTGGRGDDFDSYYRWVKHLATALRSRNPSPMMLTRYAPPVDTPTDPTPLHVLLDPDVEAFRDPSTDETIVFAETGGPVNAGDFQVVLGEEGHETTLDASIRWEPARKRYVISSDALDVLPHRSVRDENRGLLHAINAGKSMRVVSASGPVYSGGSFWDITIPADIDNGILSALTPVPALSTATKEKGAGTSKGWPEDSVFGIIEQVLAPQHFASNALLLCTDLGSEVADFIACDDGRVAFIHAKAYRRGSASTVSGAAFHEVVSQAVKNLRYLTLGNPETPRNNYWTNDWDGITPRRRRGPVLTTGGRYWEYVNERIQSHAIYREVWVVAGASLSKAELRAQLADATTPQAIQTYVLLTGLWSAAQQCGVRARVFCSP